MPEKQKSGRITPTRMAIDITHLGGQYSAQLGRDPELWGGGSDARVRMYVIAPV
jgi:hypothetical protein